MTAGDSIHRSAFWAALETGGLVGLQFATLIVMARFLEPSDFGVATLALAVVTILNLFVEHLFVGAIVQRPVLEQNHLDAAFSTSFAIGVALVTICLLGADAYSGWFARPRLPELLQIMALVLLFSGRRGVVEAVLRREMRFREVALGNLAGRVAGSLVAISMAIGGFGIWSFAGQQIAAFACTAAVLERLSPRKPRLRLSLARLRDLGGFALGDLATEGVVICNQQVFFILFGNLLGPIALGHLNFASRLAENLRNIMTTVAYNLTMSVFSRQQEEPAALRHSLYGAVEIAALLALPLFTGLAVCAEEVVTVLFGDEWLVAVSLVQLLALACMIAITVLPLQTGLDAIGRPLWFLASRLVEAAVMVIGFLSLSGIGLLLGGVVAILREGAAAPVDLLVARHFLGTRVRPLLKAVWRPLLATLLMAAAVTVLRVAVIDGWPAVWRLALLVPAGGAVYVSVLWLIAPRLLYQVVLVLRGGEAE